MCPSSPSFRVLASMHSPFRFLELLGPAAHILPISLENPPKCLQCFCPLQYLLSLRSFCRSYACVHLVVWNAPCRDIYCVLTCWGNHPRCLQQGGTGCNHSVRMGPWPVHCFSLYFRRRRDLGGHRHLTWPGRQLRVKTESYSEHIFCAKIQLLRIFDQEIYRFLLSKK